MICEYCKYEFSDCKGEKGSVRCKYFKKPLVFNAHDIAERVSVLEEENRMLKSCLSDLEINLSDLCGDIEDMLR